MLKILCLHGKQQNKTVFRTKLGRIPPKLKNCAVLTIVDAPLTCTPSAIDTNLVDDSNVEESEDSERDDSAQRTWYHRNDADEVDSR